MPSNVTFIKHKHLLLKIFHFLKLVNNTHTTWCRQMLLSLTQTQTFALMSIASLCVFLRMWGKVVWTSYKMQTFCTFWTFEHRDLEILPCYNKRSSLHHAFYWFMLAKCSKAKWLVDVFDFIIKNSWFSHQQKVRI